MNTKRITSSLLIVSLVTGLTGCLTEEKREANLEAKVAMDRAEVVSLDEKLVTPAGQFLNCVKTEESSGVEKVRENKLYAPGVGLVYDGELKLKSYVFSRQ